MQRLVEYADELVTSVGPRPGASKGEHQAAELIATHLENMGLETQIQEFISARSIGWVRVLYYLLGAAAAVLLFAMPGLRFLAFVLAFLTAGLLILDLIGKNPLYNLFNKGLSQNVIARYIPDGADPRRKVVIIAHYDSGRSMLQCAPAVAPFYTIIRMIIRLCIIVLLAVALLSLFPFSEIALLVLSVLALVIGSVLLIAALVEIINLFMPYNQGANCNASGVAAMMGVAETLTGLRDGSSVDYGFRESAAEPSVIHTRSGIARGRDAAAVSVKGEGAYDEHELRSPDARTRSGGALAEIGGAAGSLLSKARGLVGKKSSRAKRDRYYDEHEEGVEEHRRPVRRQSRQNIKITEDESSQTVYADSSESEQEEEKITDRSLEVGTADLGAEFAGAARAAAEYTSQPQRETTRRRASQGRERQSPTARPLAPATAQTRDSNRSGMPSAENPAIRTRLPLAEQEKQERAAQAKVEAGSQENKIKEGMPAWFVDAKKAAHKESEKSSAAKSKSKISRSRFADVPLEYKQKSTSSSPQNEQAFQQVLSESSFTHEEREQKSKTSQKSEVPQKSKTSSAVKGAPDSLAQQDRTPKKRDKTSSSRNGEDAPQAQTSSQSTRPRTRKAPPLDQEASAVTERSVLREPQPSVRTKRSIPAKQFDSETTKKPLLDREPSKQDKPTAKQRVQQSSPGQKSVPVAEPPSTLNADFSGLDRLSSDPAPAAPSAKGSRLPQSASSLEHAAAAPSPEIPMNDRLRNLPTMQGNSSGAIPTQQAAFNDQQTLFEFDEQAKGSNKVSNTGSFAPLGATGVMKPVGEELLEYNTDDQDIYIHDADEHDVWDKQSGSDSGSQVPHVMEMPKSRAKSFFGNLGDRFSGNRKSEKLDSTPATWLGVDEDYDARTEGSNIGGWDNFSEEEDEDWKGGAYGGESFEEDLESLAQFSSLLIDKEVWIVAVGSHENKNAGIKNLLLQNERPLKSALVINLDGVGAGDLCFTTKEGSFRPRGTDRRLQGLIKSASKALGVKMKPLEFKGYNTDARAALSAGTRAISILGLKEKLPAGWRWSDDHLDILEEENIEAVSDVVIEVIKSI